MLKTSAYAAILAKAPLTPYTMERREPGPHEVLIDILYCGICHSDIHQARDEWSGSLFPMVPGHEIVGTVDRVGEKVTRWKKGDAVGVGSLIGGIRETQEMLDFCATNGVLSDVEVIPIQKVNEAYERVIKSDVRYRFVIDMASLKENSILSTL
jgi:D-arabinose 1-dehydrogenase-like Zn-dependent alcohol dehydrogenase